MIGRTKEIGSYYRPTNGIRMGNPFGARRNTEARELLGPDGLLYDVEQTAAFILHTPDACSFSALDIPVAVADEDGGCGVDMARPGLGLRQVQSFVYSGTLP